MRQEKELRRVRDDLEYLLNAARIVGESAEENAEVISAKVVLDWVLQDGKSAVACESMFKRLGIRLANIRSAAKAGSN